MRDLTQQEVQRLFEYRDGHLYWRMDRNNRVKKGSEAGHQDKRYRRIHLGDKVYSTHRIVFLYNHGFLPEYIDHIDGDKTNNNIDNLRQCTSSQNSSNRIPHNGMKGVDHTPSNKWRARIMHEGKRICIGSFSTAEDAARAYDQFAKEHHGEYARLNIG